MIGIGWDVTTNLHQVPRSRMVELYLHPLSCIHGTVLNYIFRRIIFRLPSYARDIKCGVIINMLIIVVYKYILQT
jgi:hypothetical protein